MSSPPPALPRDLLVRRLEGTLDAIASLRAMADEIGTAIDRIAQVLGKGMLCTAGNGGSAAQALHLAEELIGRYRSNRTPLRAVCLNADGTALTCIANDFGYDQVFARQCEALLGPGDGLLVLSTSGRSPSILEALKAARRRGATTFGLLGRDGGPAAALCDVALIVPTQESAFIQEAHQVLIHLICEAFEPCEGG